MKSNKLMLTRFRGLCIALPVVAAFACLASPAHGAGLLIADGGLGGVLEIKEHDVKVTLNNGVAVTEVQQVFLNTESRIVEALYTFPVPKGASVANFSMWIDGKEMIGEVVEKQRAREIYQSYKQQRRDPGLLEQVDYKTFEMRIFPIAAGAEQRVRITYYQELDADHDWATYVYPLATVTRNNINQRTTGKFALTLDVKSEVPIAQMASPSHKESFIIVPHSEHYFQASMETTAGDMSRDLVVAYQTKRPRTGIDVITSKEQGEDGYFQLTLTAGEELEQAATGCDYVFVLDSSGSMAHDGKLATSQQSIYAFIDALGPEDRFELITFNVSANTLFNDVVPVDDARKAEARAFLETQQARGGTVLHPAINAAYRYGDPDRPLNVVILSDGMTEQGEHRELIQLMRQKPAHARVFCIAVGNEVNRPLLEQIAQDAGGLAAFISQDDDFSRQAQAFRRKLLHPVATDLAISFSGADVYDVEPSKLPNLYHGTPVRIYGRYKKGGAVNVTVQGSVFGAPLKQTVDVNLPAADDANPEIERMWAFNRVQRLLSEGRADGSINAVVDEVVELCEVYSIVSEYASFIVLENDGEYQRWKIERRNLSRVSRDRRAQEQVRTQLEALRNRSATNLGPATAFAVASASAVNEASAMPRNQNNQATAGRNDGNSRDFNVPTGGGGGGIGGGAIDPLSGGLALTVAGAALIANRRKRKGAA